MSDPEGTPRPTVEVRRGHPTDEELAAVVAVVDEAWAQEKADATAPPAARRSRWALSARGVRTPLDRNAGWVGPVG
ncbi:acyl-CoA carboxylase epsilon subunit [Microbacterium sp. NPDC091313]